MNITGIGQDSHKIIDNNKKELVIAGVKFDEQFSMDANSDGDVVLHSITNAISSITTVNILGKIADEMCKKGITDSKEYLKEALSYLGDIKINHVAISIEAKRPKFSPKIEEMRNSIANLLNIDKKNIGITATTGEGLTECGKGNGIFATTIISCSKSEEENNEKM